MSSQFATSIVNPARPSLRNPLPCTACLHRGADQHWPRSNTLEWMLIVSPLDASVHGLEETSKDMKNLNIGQPRVFLKVATPDEGVKCSVSVT